MAHREFAEENYLETIYMMKLKNEEVRNMDLADNLGVARATVTEMLKKLSSKGYITYGGDKVVKLTKKGEILARDLYIKHKYLTEVLIHLGVDKEIAAIEACQIEHVISDSTFKKIQNYFNDKI